MKRSAGIVLVRLGEGAREGVGEDPEVLLVHPGGPFWKNKDLGAWSIPKGEHGSDEDPEEVARREFEEETGVPCPPGVWLPLGSIRQRGGKVVSAWCAVGSIDTSLIRSNTFEMMWPPRSGIIQTFPEVDRAEFFTRGEAQRRVLPSQAELIDIAFVELHRAGLLRS